MKTPESPHPPDGPDPTAAPRARVADPSESVDATTPVSTRPTVDRRQQRVSHLLIAALCAVLGFAIVVQVRQTDSGNVLSTARPADLVTILDSLNRRNDDLNAEIAELQRTLAALRAGGASSQAALEEAQRRAEALAILAGTAAAAGPGVTIVITDEATGVTPEVLLAALQELRNAGAEAVQVNRVRIGVDSWFGGSAGAVVVDNTPITAPYTLIAIGDPPTMTAALDIPGGVSDTVRRAGGTLTVTGADRVVVDALRPLRATTYASPAGG